jgi:acyl-coenzyme A synthetase/AMP-(fatty) acid ligase
MWTPGAEPTFQPAETLPAVIKSWAHREPERPFLKEVGGPARSYGELHLAALRWAGAFHRAGVRADDNVPAMVRTSVSAAEQWLGLAWLRAVQTGVNTDFHGQSLAYVITNSLARRMMCAREFLGRVAAIASEVPDLELIIVPDAQPDELSADFPVPLVAAVELWDTAGLVDDGNPPQRHEIACISYTSGTTGASKGVLVPWGRFGVMMRTTFGGTEIGTPLYAGPDVSAGRASTGKWVTAGYEVRVVDEHDYPVPDGQIGELIIRTAEPWRMLAGYFGMPEKTAQAWRNGWFHTGDGVVRDERGRYHFVDRIKDSMRRRGENISSMEVEAYVNEHDAVSETAAIAVPSEFGEDDVKVCVLLHEGARLAHAELHAFLAERMPAFMVPRYIEFVKDPERTEAMKRIKKGPLRANPLNEQTWDAQASKAGT